MNQRKFTYTISLMILFCVFFASLSLSYDIKSQANMLNDKKENILRKIPKLSDTEINIITPQNITYSAPMNGYYLGTYGFENEQDGSTPEGWTQEGGGNGYVWVTSGELGHNKILRVQERDTYQISKNVFSSVFTNGTIVLWVKYGVYSTDNPKIADIKIYESADIEGIYLRMDDGSLQYYADGGWNYIQTALAETWYHLRFDFESGSNNYEGLGSDKWHLYVDGVKKSGTGYNYKANNNGMNILELYVYSPGYYHLHVDAVDYSWDPDYNLGDNTKEGLLLNYETSFKPDWQGYSLDGLSNKTILGNIVFPFLSEGLHTIQVFGNDSLGTMYESNLVYFTIGAPNLPPNTPSEIPIELIIITVVIFSIGVFILGFGSFYIYNRRKTRIFIDEKAPNAKKFKLTSQGGQPTIRQQTIQTPQPEKLRTTTISREGLSTEQQLVTCPFCKKKLPKNFNFCIHCGSPLRT